MGIAAPDQLLSVLEALKPALKSIDIRTVAVTPSSEEQWQNLITSIYVTEKTVDETRNQQKKIPQLRNNNFVLLLNAYSFDYTVFEEIIRGEVRFPTPFGINKVQFRKFDPFKLKVHSTQERINGTLGWILRAADSGQEQEREKLWLVTNGQEREAKLQGYSDIIKLIKNRLRIKYNNRERKDFELVIPPLARIENVRFVNSKFEVEVKKVAGLTDLQLNLALERSDQGGFLNPIWSNISKVKEKEPQSPDNFCVETESFELGDLLPYDLMNVELIHRESALTMDKTWLRAPFENIVEPFLKALNAFCPLENFKKMIFEPENYGKDPEQIFENAVTWLLSLTGYATIHLGVKIKSFSKKKGAESFDVIRAESNYPLACADILAYEENKKLLFVDCDIGSLDDKKIQKLIETGKHFSDTLDKYKQLQIIPVLVTPKDCRHEVKEGLRIVDRYALEMIFERLAKGDREGARDAFS